MKKEDALQKIENLEKLITAADTALINPKDVTELKRSLTSLTEAFSDDIEAELRTLHSEYSTEERERLNSVLGIVPKLIIQINLSKEKAEAEEAASVAEIVKLISPKPSVFLRELGSDLDEAKQTIGTHYKAAVKASDDLLTDLRIQFASFTTELAEIKTQSALTASIKKYKDSCLKLVNDQKGTFQRDLTTKDYFGNMYTKVENAIKTLFHSFMTFVNSMLKRDYSAPKPNLSEEKNSVLTGHYNMFTQKIAKFDDTEPDTAPVQSM